MAEFMDDAREGVVNKLEGRAATWQQAQSGLKDPQKLPQGQVNSKTCTASCWQAGCLN